MVQITISDDLARAIENAGPLVTLVDSKGHAVGQLNCVNPIPSGAPEAAVGLKRMDDAKRGGTFFTTAEVLSHLRERE